MQDDSRIRNDHLAAQSVPSYHAFPVHIALDHSDRAQCRPFTSHGRIDIPSHLREATQSSSHRRTPCAPRWLFAVFRCHGQR